MSRDDTCFCCFPGAKQLFVLSDIFCTLYFKHYLMANYDTVQSAARRRKHICDAIRYDEGPSLKVTKALSVHALVYIDRNGTFYHNGETGDAGVQTQKRAFRVTQDEYNKKRRAARSSLKEHLRGMCKSFVNIQSYMADSFYYE